MSSFNFLIPWIENLTTLERLKYTRVFRSWLATTNPPTSGKSERTEPDSNEGWGAFLCAVDSTHCAAIWKTLRKDVCGPCAFFDGSWNKAVFYLVSFQGCIRSVFWGGLAPTTARLAEKKIMKKWNKAISSYEWISGSGLMRHATTWFFAGGGRAQQKKKNISRPTTPTDDDDDDAMWWRTRGRGVAERKPREKKIMMIKKCKMMVLHGVATKTVMLIIMILTYPDDQRQRHMFWTWWQGGRVKRKQVMRRNAAGQRDDDDDDTDVDDNDANVDSDAKGSHRPDLEYQASRAFLANGNLFATRPCL